MRPLVLGLMLVTLSACGVSLQTHARALSVSRDLIDSVGEALETEAQEDFDAVLAKYEGAERDQQLAVLRGIYEPLREGYDQVVVAWKAYFKAVSEASRRGDGELEQQPARDLLKVWAKLESVAERLGLELAGPPGALTDMAGGSP